MKSLERFKTMLVHSKERVAERVKENPDNIALIGLLEGLVLAENLLKIAEEEPTDEPPVQDVQPESE